MRTDAEVGGSTRSTRPTIVDVATRAGVSKSLVSLVMRGSPGVSPAKRAAVQRAAKELGYRPNRAARSLVEQRTYTIGATLSDLRHPWFIDLLASIRTELTSSGYNLFLAEDQQIEADASVMDAFVEAGVDGLLCLGTIPVNDQVIRIVKSVPTVVVSGREPDVDGVDVIAGDDYAGASRAVRHLIEMGHTRIAHLAGTGRAADLRTSGYRDAMLSSNLGSEICIEVSDRSEHGDIAATHRLLTSHKMPTAIFANNDYAAILAMSYARERGIKIPEHLSIVGYDNSYLARLGYIGLTTIDNNYDEMGQLAVRRLLSRINSPAIPRTVTLLDPSLQERRSVARIPR